MRYASIDIGTNTILMLIGEIDGSGKIIPIKDFYSVPRIGKSVSVTRELDTASIARAIDVLGKYRETAEEYGVDRIVASATSAVRDATNRSEFVAAARDACGIVVEVIDGPTEGRLSFLGAVSGDPDTTKSSLVIDIGGGSTEFGFGTGMEPSITRSVNIGAVRLTEMFFKHNPPTDDELERTREFIDESLISIPVSEVKADRVFAVAGTATTLALIAQNRYRFDPAAVNNFRMNTSTLKEVFELLRRTTPEGIRKLTEAAEGREDVILAGALVLSRSLDAAGATEFLSTDRGLRYGYLFHKYVQIAG